MSRAVTSRGIFPAVWALILSFQKWDGFSEPKFVGLQNYQKLMSDSDFFDAVVHTGMRDAVDRTSHDGRCGLPGEQPSVRPGQWFPTFEPRRGLRDSLERAAPERARTRVA